MKISKDVKRVRKPGQSQQKIKFQKDNLDKLYAAKMGADYDKECWWILYLFEAPAKYLTSKEAIQNDGCEDVSDAREAVAHALRPLGEAILQRNWGLFERMSKMLKYLKDDPGIRHEDIYHALRYYLQEDTKYREGRRIERVSLTNILDHLADRGIILDARNFSRLWKLIGLPLKGKRGPQGNSKKTSGLR
jgi:hypothetical protein